MTLRSCSAPTTSSSATRQRLAARLRWRRGSCTGWKRSQAEERWEAAKAAGEKYVRFATELDRPDKVEPIAQPAPKPPRATRPLKLSVTAIEDWLRDPYTIYAKYILKLDPLDPVDMPLSAADRGSAIHEALGEFTKTFAAELAGRSGARIAHHRRKIFRALDGASRGAGAMVAAIPAHRRLVRRMGDGAARPYRSPSRPRSGARSAFPSTTSALLSSRRARTGSSAATTARLRSSTTRPGSRRRANRCAWACRRSSRWKRRSCVKAALRTFPPALRSPNSSMSGSAATTRRASSERWN